MKKIISFALILLLVFALVGCKGKDVSKDPANNGKTDNGGQLVEGEDKTETGDKAEREEYVPEKAVPKDLPVPPGASLTGEWDFPGSNYGENSWQWNYKSNASGNEIVEFFRKEFESRGLEIDEDFTGTGGEEIFVNTKCRTAGIWHFGEDDYPEGIDGDTPGRHYAIVVDLDKWYGVDPKDKPEKTYVPQKEFPKNLPSYPGAVIISDTSISMNYGENCWQWIYESDASGNEIVDFYKRELEKLGYEVEYATAYEKSINVQLFDYDILIQDYIDFSGTSDLPDEVDADTPGRTYYIIVNLDKI